MSHFLRILVVLFAPLAAVAADPPKAEEKAKRNPTVERIKLVGLGGLLEQQGVRKQLELTKEQDDKLAAAQDDAAKGVKGLLAESKSNPKLSGDYAAMQAMMDRLADHSSDFDKAAAKVFTAEQAYRLKQVILQREGPTAYLNRFAVRELALTPEQEDKIGEAVSKLTRPKYTDFLATFVVMSEDPMVAKMIQQRAAALDDLREAAAKHLTTDQKAKWKLMTGEEVATPILIVASPEAFLMKLAYDANK